MSAGTMLRGLFTVAPEMLRNKIPDEIAELLPTVMPTWGKGADKGKIKATWLGCVAVSLDKGHMLMVLIGTRASL
jgi:hypothetical protein